MCLSDCTTCIVSWQAHGVKSVTAGVICLPFASILSFYVNRSPQKFDIYGPCSLKNYCYSKHSNFCIGLTINL